MADAEQDSGVDAAAMTAFFDRHGLAGVWEEFSPGEWCRVEPLLRALELQPGMSVFEPGCGPGRLTTHLAARVGRRGRVVACDLSGEMAARAQARRYAAQVTVLHGDALTVPIDATDFDRIVVFNALPHFADLPTLFRRMAALLKPTGRLAILHSDGRAIVNARHDHIGHTVAGHHLPDAATMQRLHADAGLRILSMLDEPRGYAVHSTPR